MSRRPTQPKFNANDIPLPPKRDPLNDSDAESLTSSSDDETEDEDGEELTPVMDAAILRTLSRIRRGEGVEGGRKVFEEEQAALLASTSSLPTTKPKPKATKPIHLSDFQRQALLDSTKGGSVDSTPLPTHAEEQEALRRETLNAFSMSVDDADVDEGDDDDATTAGGLFQVKSAVTGEDMEDEEYRAFLLGSGGGEEGIRQALGLDQKKTAEAADDGEKGGEDEEEEGEKQEGVEGEGEKKKRKRTKRKPKVLTAEDKKQKDEEFLLDYILNRGWIDRSADHVPSYADMTTSKVEKKKKKKKSKDEENSDLSADEDNKAQIEDDDDEFDDAAEEFETRYNFRFEEPDAAIIPTHPRILPEAARRPDTARKEAREVRKERKAAEKAAREEERRRIKGEKRREIEKKLELLGLGKGGQALRMEDLDLDAEYDAEEHDRKMAELFESGNDWNDDDEKPTWDDEDGGMEGYEFGVGGGDDDDEEGMMGYGDDGMGMDEDEGTINMDADALDEEAAPKLSKKEKKRLKKEKEALKKAGKSGVVAEESHEVEVEEYASLLGEDGQPLKPFEGTEEEKLAKAEEIMDEYYALDHEDMIGGRPTRFQYTKTAPQTYGLSPAEILLATDAELNAFMGVKQYAAFRSDGGANAGRVGREKRLWELRKALKGRKWGEDTPELEGKRSNKKRTWDQGQNNNQSGGEKGPGKKRKGRKERMKEKAATEAGGAAPAPALSAEDGGAKKKRKTE